MATFNNLKDLFKHLEKSVQDGMKDVGNKTKEIAQQHVNSDVYDKYTPKKYERTYELRDSIDSFEASGGKGEFVAIVQHDTSKISSSKEPTYNHYSKTPNGYDPDVSDEYMQWVHDGTSGNAFGYGEWTKPRPYMDNAYDEISKTNVHVETLKDSLKRKGLDVEVK